jgi:membrane protease YdiL (CAAX protease family)
MILFKMTLSIAVPMNDQQYINFIFQNPLEFIFVFFSLCIVPAFVEEIFFRKIMIDELVNIIPKKIWLIILIQALIFYIAHLPDGNWGLHVFLSGIVLGVIYICTGSSGYSILVHILYNTTGFLFMTQILNELTLNLIYKYYIWLFFISLVCITIILNRFVRYVYKSNNFADILDLKEEA